MNIPQKTKSRHSLKVFLSYSHKDEEYGRKLRKILSTYPDILRIFTPEMLSAGEGWSSKLKDEISHCDVFMVLLSANTINSEWVLSELGAAWALNKLIIPVIISETRYKIPLDLEDIQYVDLKHLEDHPEVIDEIVDNYEEKAISSMN
jgi:hypothetical protein